MVGVGDGPMTMLGEVDAPAAAATAAAALKAVP